MPWYWSDDVARVLLELGKIDRTRATDLVSRPVAFRCEAESLEKAALKLLDDEEIPLAA